jgi:hypothetical protein
MTHPIEPSAPTEAPVRLFEDHSSAGHRWIGAKGIEGIEGIDGRWPAAVADGHDQLREL